MNALIWIILIFWLGPKIWDKLILPIINYPREIMGKEPLPTFKKKAK
jgi:hypothetical protein